MQTADSTTKPIVSIYQSEWNATLIKRPGRSRNANACENSFMQIICIHVVFPMWKLYQILELKNAYKVQCVCARSIVRNTRKTKYYDSDKVVQQTKIYRFETRTSWFSTCRSLSERHQYKYESPDNPLSQLKTRLQGCRSSEQEVM